MTLTIGAGSVIVLDPGLEIEVLGSIIVNGTKERPVVFSSQDRTIPWGGFLFETASSTGQFTGSILTASGEDSNWFSNNSGKGHSHRGEQCLFFLSNGANVNLTDCYIVDNHGQAGHGENGYLTLTGCLIQKCITAGQYNGGAVVLNDCALIEFPFAKSEFFDDDNDGFYLTGGAHSLTDTLIGWALDDGIDAGSGDAGSVTVDNCWFESCFHEAMAWSKSRDADVTGTVAINCGQGIECGYGGPAVDAVGCLSTANAVGVRFGDNYDWDYTGFLDVTDSLLVYNLRDVWGRAWDNWNVHLSQMDVHSNYLTIPNDNFPANTLWDPINVPGQSALLEPFLTSAPGNVGVGIATTESLYGLDGLPDKIPVRLSIFTTNLVSVDYSIKVDNVSHDGGTLQFAPGQTVQNIAIDLSELDEFHKVLISLSGAVNADVTTFQQVTYLGSYETVEHLVSNGDVWNYFKGSIEPRSDWNQLVFDDDLWLTGPGPIGYETSSGYESCIATNLTDMKNGYLSVYARREFTITDPTRLSRLMLTMDYDDGYIAYINGVEVSSKNPPSPVAHDEPTPSSSHEACCSCRPEQIDLTEFIGILETGTNVFAVQGHNASTTSSDFIIIAGLYSVVGPWPGDFEPDGDVDLDDFSILAASWLTQPGQSRYNPVCDISSPVDNSIDMQDLLVFVNNWLSSF